MNAGIYAIENTINNKVYIGSSADTQRRIWEHRHQLNEGKHRNAHLRYSWNKYGKDAFVFFLIEHCKKEELIEREQNAMDIFGVVENGYNIRIKAESNLGLTMSPEARKKISEVQKGKRVSLETRKRISEASKGKIISPETIRKISEAQKRRMSSPEVRKKMSEAHKGKIASQKTRRKMSEAATGKITSQETKRKISEALKGKMVKEKHCNWKQDIYRPPCPLCGGDHIVSSGKSWTCIPCGKSFSKKRIAQ